MVNMRNSHRILISFAAKTTRATKTAPHSSRENCMRDFNFFFCSREIIDRYLDEFAVFFRECLCDLIFVKFIDALSFYALDVLMNNHVNFICILESECINNFRMYKFEYEFHI